VRTTAVGPTSGSGGDGTLTVARVWIGLAAIAVASVALSVAVDRSDSLAPQPPHWTYRPTRARVFVTPRAPQLPPGSGALIALVVHRTALRSAPDGRSLARLGTRTEFGSPEVLWVVRHTPRWLGVISPLVGNERLGWIPRSSASLGRVTWELRVSLSARALEVVHDGRVDKRYTVAIGQPGAPTPTGRFAVTDRLLTDDSSGPYGCCILALSARAPHAIQGWSGGDRIAIHATPEDETIGEAVSHGCLRLTDAEARWLLSHIPLGTPVVISA
jgi:L,D-transpeptidase catalytic domain